MKVDKKSLNKASLDLFNELKSLVNILSIDPDDYPDMGAYRQTMTQMKRAKKVLDTVKIIE